MRPVGAQAQAERRSQRHEKKMKSEVSFDFSHSFRSFHLKLSFAFTKAFVCFHQSFRLLHLKLSFVSSKAFVYSHQSFCCFFPSLWAKSFVVFVSLHLLSCLVKFLAFATAKVVLSQVSAEMLRIANSARSLSHLFLKFSLFSPKSYCLFRISSYLCIVFRKGHKLFCSISSRTATSKRDLWAKSNNHWSCTLCRLHHRLLEVVADLWGVWRVCTFLMPISWCWLRLMEEEIVRTN